MRLIIGFIFFGLLFYAMSIYTPEIFQTLVSWAAKTFEFINNAVDSISNKSHAPANTPAPVTPKALLPLIDYIRLSV